MFQNIVFMDRITIYMIAGYIVTKIISQGFPEFWVPGLSYKYTRINKIYSIL